MTTTYAELLNKIFTTDGTGVDAMPGTSGDAHTWTSNTTVYKPYTPASPQVTIPNHDDITFNQEGIEVGDLKMTYKEFEVCMKHLLQLAKKDKPEEFI